jgi:PPOX class probable F420-dependent enzyme
MATTTIPASHLDLFEKKAFAYLATHLHDHDILVNPVWCDYDGTYVLLNSARGRLKDRMMRRNPHVTLCIADPENPYRYLEIRGRVADITTEGAEAHIDRLAQKYLGQVTYPFRQTGEVRVLYRIEPKKVVPFAT